MHELVINLHMHTRYSDGFGSHADIAQAAIQTGLDVVIVTDHNVLVRGPEGYHKNGQRRVLLLVGEEVHDQARNPQKNHLLVLGAERELATFADDPQRLVDAVRQADGLSFIAHPVDPAAPAVGEDDLSWVSWEVQGFTGLELWNALTEFKIRLKTRLHALYYAYQPQRIARGPLPEVLARWDALLAEGRQVVAVGGSDAHAIPARLGPLKRTIFPYAFHFQAVNTHLLTPEPLTGDVITDRRMIYQALRRGNAFIGYDLPAETRGFRFTAQGANGLAWMGDEIELSARQSATSGITLQIRLPLATECRLIHNGQVIKQWANRQTCTHITTAPGAYRVEAYLRYLGRRRGWIFSNPIYVRPASS
jgi:hypothetical protein